MSLTRNRSAGANTGSTVKSAKRARAAGSAAAGNAAQNAAVAAQNAAAVAAAAAANAAQSASGAAQTAAAGLSNGVKQGVYTARSWAAPRLDTAAEYCTTTVAPKVTAALHTTARQVNPEPAKSKRSAMLTWPLLGAAILAAIAAAGAVVRYRYRTAIAADSEAADEEMPTDSTGSLTPSTKEGGRAAAETASDKDAETSVNGRVSASGW